MILHVPPVVASAAVVVLPTQTGDRVMVAVVLVLMVTGNVALQPDLLYEIVAVPAATPVTIPVLLTVAEDVVDDDQTPPVVASVNVAMFAVQSIEEPTIADGDVLTVVEIVLKQPFIV